MKLDWNDMYKNYVEEAIKEFSGKKPVAFLKISESRLGGVRKILVFDDTEENIYIERYTLVALDSNKASRPFYTIPYDEILKLKKLAENPALWLDQEDSMDYVNEADFIVMDGTDQELTVFKDGEYRCYDYSNLPRYKKYLNNYPQAKAALNFMEKLLKTVRKNTDTKLI